MKPAQFVAEPVLVAPHYTGVAADLARPRDETWDHSLEMAAIFGVQFGGEIDRPYAFADGIAFVPVRGSLINRCNYSWGGYITGYKYITSLVAAIAQDPGVKGVVFDVDSYGGEAAGCFETGRFIREALTAAKIPSMAMVDSNAQSAGYALACAADRVVLIPSGRAGSIGAIMMHWDMSREMEMEGEKVTIFAAGSHKADGNPFGPLPADVAAAFQARIDTASANFCAYVAEMRGKPTQAITDLQAASFDAPQALALGLVDSVAPAPEAFATFLESLSDLEDEESGAINLEAQMPDPTAAEGAASERARIQAILSSPEADGRGKLAQHLAFNTTQPAADAVALLAAAEKATAAPAPVAAPPAADPLAAAMRAAGTPGVSPEGPGASEPDTPEAKAKAAADFMLASFAQATGRKPVTK